MSASLEAQLRLDIAQYQAQLAKARGEAKKFRDQVTGSSGLGDVMSKISGMAGAAGIGLTFTTLVKRGFEFNKTIGDSEVAIGNVLRQFKGLSSEAAKQEAAEAMKAMVELEPQTAASLTGLVDGLMATLGASQSVGIDVRQNIGLVGKFANALANSNIPAQQLAQEMRSIMTGNIGADSSLAKVLNITNEDVNRARQAGQLYQFLSDKIGLLGVAGDSAGVAFSTLSSAIDKAAGALTEGLFEQGVDVAKSLAEVLEENRDLFVGIGKGIALAGNELMKFISFMNESRKIIMELSGVSQGLRILDARNAAAEGAAMAQPGVAASFNAVREAIAPRPSAANSGQGAVVPSPEQIKAQREINQLLEKQSTLDEKRFADYLSILPASLKLIELKRELLRIEEENATIQGPGLDDRRIENETRILSLRQQMRAVLGDIAEQERQQDAKGQALADLQAEMDIIREQAAGRKEKAQALQQELEIQREAKRIMDETGLSEQQAMELAKEHARLKEQLAKGEDGDSKIKGYNRANQGGAAEARQRAADRLTASRDRTDKAVTDAFGTLPPRDAEGNLQNPLSGVASRNAANETQRNNTVASTTGTAEQAAQIVITSLPQILSTLTGA